MFLTACVHNAAADNRATPHKHEAASFAQIISLNNLRAEGRFVNDWRENDYVL